MTTLPTTLDLAASDLDPSREFARHLDSIDPFARVREQFEFPRRHDGSRVGYFTGNSLGLMPSKARTLVSEELDDWATLAVEGHLESRRPWLSYHELFRDSGARLVGARPGEVVMMNTLTVNLHLLMVSFYRPAGKRTRVLMEQGAFPSDNYAVASHVASRGLDPAAHIIKVGPRPGEDLIRTEDFLREIERHGDELALVMIGGVNYLTGQLFDIRTITAAAQKVGARCGWDLAHGAGNVPLSLHDWNVDFACWCSYKYLNAGPGSVAGVFVHERHGANPEIPRYCGWWSNEPATRFQMKPELALQRGADGWQVSNPPILSLTPLLASLEIFDAAGGVAALRRKSRVLTGYLEFMLRHTLADRCTIVTPADAETRGCQLSLRFKADARTTQKALAAKGFFLDIREPDILRAAPVPLYNTFEDAWQLAHAL